MEQGTLPKVSIILGVKNGIRTIEKFIKSIKSQTYPHIEFIVVDNYSTDGTAEICKNSADLFFTRGPERSAQRNFGIQQATGKYILIVDADMYLSENVVKEAVELCVSTKDLLSLSIPEETIAGGFWGKCKKFERDFYLIGDASVDAARFFSAEELRSIGGYNEDLVGSEDWDLSDRFTKKFPKTSHIKARIIHDEGYINLKELLRKKKYYAQTGTSNYLSNPDVPAIRKTPFPLRPSVKKQWYRFLLHPILGVGSIVLKFREGMSVTNWQLYVSKTAKDIVLYPFRQIKKLFH